MSCSVRGRCMSLPFVVAASAGAACVVGTPRQADAIIHTISRINDYSLSFDNLQFANTMMHLSIRQDRRADAAGDTLSESFSVVANYSNNSWQAFDGVALSNINWTPTTVSGTITSPAGLAGHTVLRYDAPPNGTNVAVDLFNNRYRMTVAFQSGGGVDIGSPSSWTMTIPGDWSAAGTGFHQHELVSYNSAWTLLRNFEYDPMLDATVFRIATDSYQSPPSPNFRLYGIPSPASAGLIALGAAGTLRRRRRAG